MFLRSSFSFIPHGQFRPALGLCLVDVRPSHYVDDSKTKFGTLDRYSDEPLNHVPRSSLGWGKLIAMEINIEAFHM